MFIKAKGSKAYILLKLCKGFPDAVLLEDHSFTVGPALHRGVQGLADGEGEQRVGGGAMDVAGGQRGDVRWAVYVEGTGGIQETKRV